MYFKHSVLTRALLQKSIYSAFFLTTEDVFFVIHADHSAENAVERFEDGDDNFGVDVSIEDVFFVIHADDSAENAVERFEDGDDNFGVDVSIDNGVDT